MTTSTPAITDPRPLWFAAMDWVTGLAAAVPAERLGDPTPCDDWDVRTLIAHLATTVRRPASAAAGTDPMVHDVVSSDALDDPAAVYAAEVAAARELLSGPDADARLDQVSRMPFGEVPLRGALWAFLNETLVHGWDLALATGQDPEADPAIATAALAVMRNFLPDGAREGLPFAPPIEPAPDAGPTERIANWSGRARWARPEH